MKTIIAIDIVPKTPEQVALLMGIKVEELDWRIQYWRSGDCVREGPRDPVLTTRNYYNGLAFSIRMAFGKKDFKSILPHLAEKYQS